jgi:chromosome segregation ATPase
MLRSCGVLVLCCITAHVQAQTARSGGGGESQRMMQQYQQLAGEKSALEAQVASLKHDLDAGRAELGTVKKERDALKAHATAAGATVAELTAGKQAAEKTAEQTKERLNELVTRFRETATDLKQVESDREQLRGQLRERSAAYDQCAADNLSLYEINVELLDRYEHVGLFTRVAASEPVTRISRNRLENLIDAYRARALELRVKSNPAGGADKAANKATGKPPSRP